MLSRVDACANSVTACAAEFVIWQLSLQQLIIVGNG
jgi:hypothetical protein